jgi:hypothetical protein
MSRKDERAGIRTQLRCLMQCAGVRIAVLCVCAVGAAIACQGQKASNEARLALSYEEPLADQRYPELVYWFVTPQTLAPERYRRDILHLADDTEFNFAFLTGREGVSFLNNPAAHQAIAGIVKDAHEHGLRIGATLGIGGGDSSARYSDEEKQTAIADATGTLDAEGRGTVSTEIALRSVAPERTRLLRVLVFRQTEQGEYDPATLKDVTTQAHSHVPKPGKISVTLQLGPAYAGYTAFVLSTTWFNTADLFNDAFKTWIHRAIDQYRDVPLDGTSLDEFKYTPLPVVPSTVWRGHFGGDALSAEFEHTTGIALDQALFNSRFAPAGHPEVRIRAIDEYWDILRKGPLSAEQEFYRYSRQVFGDKNFAGIHNTYHNHLTNDEAWATGINWWTVPRQYGMSDEDLSLPLRMGLLVAHPGNIMYDQFYGWNIHRFAEKALNDARFDARLHYHGYNDTGRWGVDLSSAPFLSQINPVERKIRLLNRFDPAAPRLPLLVVFGMPALLNWYPDESARNNYDINGSLHIEEKVQSIWDAGYRCAVVPSDLIDNGSLKLDADNHPVLNGHVFQAVVYLYPQYAKRSTVDFLANYTQHGGRLMLEGDATRGFDGAPAGDLFRKIAAKATVTGFSVKELPKLGIDPSPLRDIGGELEDGSVILTDLSSLESDQPRSFSIDVNGHRFSGSYEGVFALKATKNGDIEKLACGACSSLSRDGKPVLRLAKPADLVLTLNAAGIYEGVVEGLKGSNRVHLYR